MNDFINQNTGNLLADSAQIYLVYGLSVIPVKDKLPLNSWKPYMENRMSSESVDNFFNQPQVNGLAIICGKVSGNLEVMDFDCKYDKNGTLWQSFWQVAEDTLPGLLPRTVVTATVNGGYHLYYRCAKIEGNCKLARNEKNEVLIETRGEGGYVVAPPSTGYQLLQGNFGFIPLISEHEREVLLTIARSFDEQPPQADGEMVLPGWYHGKSPFEDYNQRGDVVTLLEKHGWKKVKEQGERIHVRRPGKSEGISGNFHTLKRIFYPFTTSTEFQSNKGYNATGVYTLLEAQGNYSLASRQLYDIGYGDRHVAVKETSVKEKKKKAPAPLIPFPIEGFPAGLQEIITTCSDTFRTPKDYWAGAVLIASALGIGNKIELQTNYRNHPILWMVLVGEVSSGKSNPIDWCLNFFQKLDSESIKKYDESYNEFSRIIRMTGKERRAEGIMEKPAKPECFQYILNDFTPEAMVEVHKINNRGLMILRDELMGMIQDFGRYNKSGEQSNMLSSWSGLAITYNRKTSGVLNVLHPCIMVTGGMQPDLLHTLADDNRAENGFLSRICAVYPENTDKANYNVATLPDRIKNSWEQYLLRLISLQEHKLTLSKEAEQLYEDWFNKNAAMINAEESGYLKGVYGKLDIISLRIAIIICGMNIGCGELSWGQVSGEEMKAALDVTEYFRATALKVYRKIFENGESSSLNKNKVTKFLYHEMGMKKAEIARVLETSRSQVDRVLEGKSFQEPGEFTLNSGTPLVHAS